MIIRRLELLFFLLAAACLAQSGNIDAAARKGIDLGNQAWIDGMKQGSATLIAATYAENAVDCPATGGCIEGRAAIEEHLKERIAKMGRALSASAASVGTTQQGDFVYEWGRSEAKFGNGQTVTHRYLTVWQRQPGGDWKIFRNMVIPDDAR